MRPTASGAVSSRTCVEKAVARVARVRLQACVEEGAAEGWDQDGASVPHEQTKDDLHHDLPLCLRACTEQRGRRHGRQGTRDVAVVCGGVQL